MVKLEKAIENLKEYVSQDVIYQNKDIENPSDFDKFCINHCKDIEIVLQALETKGKESHFISSESMEKDILNEIDFCLSGEYITLEHEQAIKKLVELYKNEKEVSHFIQSELDEANAEIIELKKMVDEMAGDLMICGMDFVSFGKFTGVFKKDKEMVVKYYQKEVRDKQ